MICSKCGCEFDRWTEVKKLTRCKNCTSKKARIREGAYATKICQLCDTPFERANNASASGRYCKNCDDMDQMLRQGLMREKKGLPPIKRYASALSHRRNKKVDKTEYVSIINLMRMPLEKLVKTYRNPNIVFVETTHGRE